MVRDPKVVSESSFVDLVGREHKGLIAASAMIVGDSAVAEEIVQDVLARTYQRWSKVSRLDRPGAWVRRAVINQSISTVRRSGTERRAMRRMRAQVADHEAAPALPNPELWAAVRSLPDNQMTAIALHYGADLALVDIASELELSESAVKALLHRARNTLREDPKVRGAIGVGAVSDGNPTGEEQR